MVEGSRVSNPWVTMVYLFHSLRLKNELAGAGKLTPHLPDRQVLRDNFHHLAEELREIGEAMGLHVNFSWDDYSVNGNVPASDLVETIDGILDLIYVAIGTALRCGVDLTPLFEEVHISNMEKEHDAEAKAAHAVKWVKKPPGWQKPRISQMLMEMGWKG